MPGLVCSHEHKTVLFTSVRLFADLELKSFAELSS